MWETWIQATTYHKLPSEVFDPTGECWKLDGEHGPLARSMFNSAVTWFGITIQNALEERVEYTHNGKIRYREKYTLARLLHPDFRLPKPKVEPVDIQKEMNPWAPLIAWVGKGKGGLVRRYTYVGPEKTVD